MVVGSSSALNEGAMLSIRGLIFQVGQMSILNGVDLDINRGEYVGIIGPNGSGKTTLFNCISGFSVPTGGSIVFRDTAITKMAPHRRAHLGIGRVFQNFGIFRDMTLLENMVTALEGRSWGELIPGSGSKKNFQLQSMEYLSMVNLEGKAHARASSLSGGQMRLLEIIRCVAFGADLLLLDEPTAGVSPKMKLEVAKVLNTLRELGKTVIVIEHDLNFIQKFCERIVVIDSGQIALSGSPDEVRNNPLIQEIYFGSVEAQPAIAANLG